jgi:hypothetical protein
VFVGCRPVSLEELGNKGDPASLLSHRWARKGYAPRDSVPHRPPHSSTFLELHGAKKAALRGFGTSTLVVLRELAAFSCELRVKFGSGFTWVVFACGRVAMGLEGRSRLPRAAGMRVLLVVDSGRLCEI